MTNSATGAWIDDDDDDMDDASSGGSRGRDGEGHHASRHTMLMIGPGHEGGKVVVACFLKDLL